MIHLKTLKVWVGHDVTLLRTWYLVNCGERLKHFYCCIIRKIWVQAHVKYHALIHWVNVE